MTEINKFGNQTDKPKPPRIIKEHMKHREPGNLSTFNPVWCNTWPGYPNLIHRENAQPKST